MAITPQQIADKLNAAGVDDEPKLEAFLAAAADLVLQGRLKSAIERALLDKAASADTHDATIAGLRAQLAAVDARLRG